MLWVFDNPISTHNSNRFNCVAALRHWLPKRWRIYLFWLSLTLIVFVFIILGAALFPRQIPCEEFPAFIGSVVTRNSVAPIPVICFARNNSVRSYEQIQVTGSCMDLSEMTMYSNFIAGVSGPPAWVWAGSYTVPNATIFRHMCNDLDLYRRPYAYICTLINIELPYQAPTVNVIEANLLTLSNPIPCNGKSWRFLVPIIYEGMLNFAFNSVAPSGFCASNSTTNITITGTDFLVIQTILNGAVNGTQQPSVYWNNVKLDSQVNMTSCFEYVTNPAVARIYTCTVIDAVIPVTSFISSDTFFITNALPCSGSTLTVANATGAFVC